MATRPRRTRAGGRGAKRQGTSAPGGTPRDRVIDALMALVAERGYMAVELPDIADRAEVSLATLRGQFSGKLAILAGFSKRIDEAVLEAGPAEGEGARDRLFDIFMRRLDALAPHKPALKRLAKAARCSPGLAAALHCIAGSSQRWMLAAAGIRQGGLAGAVALEGSVLVFAETLSAWVNDDEPDMAKTMKTLDRALDRGGRAMQMLDDLRGFACRIASAVRRPSESRAAG